MNILQKQKEAIEKLCANHHVRKLYAFGSVLTDDMLKCRIRLCLLLFLVLLSTITNASDSLVIYNMPHKILVDYAMKQAIGIEESLSSQKILDSTIKEVVPLGVSYRIVNDTSYFSPLNRELGSLMERFESGFKINKIKVPDAILSHFQSLNTSKVIFLNTSGVIKEKRDATQIIAEYLLGGMILATRKKPNLTIQTLVLDVQAKRFVYYELAGRYSKLFKPLPYSQVLKSSLEDYFTKGINILWSRRGRD